MPWLWSQGCGTAQGVRLRSLRGLRLSASITCGSRKEVIRWLTP